MKEYRTDKDMIGERSIPEAALNGIHALRAKENFHNEKGSQVRSLFETDNPNYSIVVILYKQ